MTAEPFGAYAPGPAETHARALAARLPDNYFGRKAASLLLGPAGGRARRPYDVAVFETQKARLHPYDNISEKRVFLTPQFWEREERAALGAAIETRRAPDFFFVDVGANAGLYSLFARAVAQRCGVRLRALAIEADADMQERLAFNIAASGAQDEIALSPFAASDHAQTLRFKRDRRNRGMSRLDAAGETLVEARALADIVGAAAFPRIDALKMDIEGAEFAALSSLLREAPAALAPALIILETSHEAPEASAQSLALATGYETALTTKRNAVLVRRAG